MGAIGRKLNYKGGGGGSCFSSDDNSDGAELLPASCVLWLASGPFDDPLLYWAVAVSTLTFCCALIAFFSVDIRNIISDRDFLQLLFKGWPPGQALFLSYSWDIIKREIIVDEPITARAKRLCCRVTNFFQRQCQRHPQQEQEEPEREIVKVEVEEPSAVMKFVREIGRMLPCTFIDVRCFDTGDSPRVEMDRAIKQSAFFIAFLSPKYFTSPNCSFELQKCLQYQSDACAFFVHKDDVKRLLPSDTPMCVKVQAYSSNGTTITVDSINGLAAGQSVQVISETDTGEFCEGTTVISVCAGVLNNSNSIVVSAVPTKALSNATILCTGIVCRDSAGITCGTTETTFAVTPSAMGQWAGQSVEVTAGSGAFVFGTTISKVEVHGEKITVTVTAAPTSALSKATILCSGIQNRNTFLVDCTCGTTETTFAVTPSAMGQWAGQSVEVIAGSGAFVFGTTISKVEVKQSSIIVTVTTPPSEELKHATIMLKPMLLRLMEIKKDRVYEMPDPHSHTGWTLRFVCLLMRVFEFFLGNEWTFYASPAVVTEMLIQCGVVQRFTSGDIGRSPAVMENWEGVARCMAHAARRAGWSSTISSFKIMGTSLSVEVAALVISAIAVVLHFRLLVQAGSFFFLVTTSLTHGLFWIFLLSCTFIFHFMPLPAEWQRLNGLLQVEHCAWLLCALRQLDCIYTKPKLFCTQTVDALFSRELSFLQRAFVFEKNDIAPDFGPGCVNVISMGSDMHSLYVNFPKYYAILEQSLQQQQQQQQQQQNLKFTAIVSEAPFDYKGGLDELNTRFGAMDRDLDKKWKTFCDHVLFACPADANSERNDHFPFSQLCGMLLRCGLSLSKTYQTGLTPGSLSINLNLKGGLPSPWTVFKFAKGWTYFVLLASMLFSVAVMVYPCMLRV